MSNFTPAWFKKGFFNESLFCDDFLSTHQLLYSNGAFFTPDGRMVDPMPLRCEIFEMMHEYVGANLAKKVTNVVDVLKLAAQVEDFPPVTDRIALANGTLYLDGTFQEGKPEIVRNRLPVKYDPKAVQPVHWLQFRGFTRAFQTQRKTAGGRCGMKKARRFKGNRGVPTKNTR